MANPKPAILAAVALGVAAGIVWSVGPWAAYAEQREQRADVTEELKAVREERVRMEREEAKSRSKVGQETRAREKGFRAPGEVEVKLKDEPTLPPEASNAP